MRSVIHLKKSVNYLKKKDVHYGTGDLFFITFKYGLKLDNKKYQHRIITKQSHEMA